MRRKAPPDPGPPWDEAAVAVALGRGEDPACPRCGSARTTGRLVVRSCDGWRAAARCLDCGHSGVVRVAVPDWLMPPWDA